MNANIGLDKCLTFINCQIQPQPRKAELRAKTPPWRAVTISRQTGSGGHAVAEELAKLLQDRLAPNGRPWTVFDRNLVEKVLEDHHLPKRLAQFMPEDRVSEMSDAIEEILGLHPASYTLVRQTSETILRLLDLGNVIIIGRGASVVASKLPAVFNVRLVASLETRIEHIQQQKQLGRKGAADLISREDRGRQRYLKKYFDADVNNPLLYHLVINTDRISHLGAAQIIARTLLETVTG
jgi:cytidylate kinase